MSLRDSIAVLAVAGLAAATALPAAELVEQIVCRVNDRLITQSEYDKRLAIAARAPNHPTDPNELKRAVLEDLIREKLLEERAKEESVSATEEEVDTAVARVKAQYNLNTDAEFDAALAQSGMTRDDLKRQMKETITLQKVIGRDVTSQLQLTDDQLRLEYERKKDQFYAVPESAHVAEIVIKYSPSDPDARQRAVAQVEELRSRARSGTSFGDLARSISEGTTRDKGGDLGIVSKGELVEALDAAIFVTPPEEYPAPALLTDSIHLFHVTDRKPQGYKPFAEVKEDLRKRIGDDLYDKRFTEYLDKLRRDAFVKIYVPELAKLDEKKAGG
ncbi:MAG TPA: SurA N-terminal domain-containing protein [Thermoanaerobaculia bacterium]|nr:SurA N-terminal domain-containing protein [Thermoanaerobaculia bacterium]